MAELPDPAAAVRAIEVLRESGATKIEAFTPYEVAEIQAALPPKRASRLAYAVLVAGLVGAIGAFAFEWWIDTVDYPLEVGARSTGWDMWPAFLPISFEMGVLCAGLTAFVGALALGGLPRLWHPVFEVQGFERATSDRFWIAVEDPPAKLPELGAERLVWM